MCMYVCVCVMIVIRVSIFKVCSVLSLFGFVTLITGGEKIYNSRNK